MDLSTISMRERIRLNLVAAMDAANISQVQLAKLLNLHKGTINNWVRGNSSPDVDLVPEICAALGISIGDYYGVSSSGTNDLAPEPKKAPSLEDGDEDMLELYHQLNRDGRLVAQGEVRALLREDRYRKDAQESAG